MLEDGGERAGYARAALALAGRNDVPVAAGADVRRGGYRLAEYGLLVEKRYWPEPPAPAPGPLDAALVLLEQSIEQGAIIVAIGPFTNLSLLERRSCGTLRNATLCLMGGSITPAPPGFSVWDHEINFNVQTDRHAALHVVAPAHPERRASAFSVRPSCVGAHSRANGLPHGNQERFGKRNGGGRTAVRPYGRGQPPAKAPPLENAEALTANPRTVGRTSTAPPTVRTCLRRS